MKPELTPRQQKVLADMDEMLNYAKRGGRDLRMLGLDGRQFLLFATIARKKRKYPGNTISLM